MSEAAYAEEMQQKDQPKKVVIPYTPRRHFLPLHRSSKRWKFVVAHRRAGKSVAAINEMIKRALENTRRDPPPRYAYVGPSFDQTKDLIWGYLKHFAGQIPGVEFREGDLMCVLPNGATIRLYGGAAAYERMRGLYFDGIMLDEYPLLHPAVFSTVVRPCLADYRGWAIISGTSNGDDHFAELRNKNINNPAWEIFSIPVTQTDALHPDEVVEMTADMSPEEYAREMLCSFDAPVEGSYYGDIINDMMAEKPSHVTKVPYQPQLQVHAVFDLGIDDATAVWFFQFVGQAIHFIRYKEWTGKGLPEIYSDIKGMGYNIIGELVMPHDIKARELGSGKSRFEVVTELHGDVPTVCPMHRVEDGIEATRSMLRICFFDEENCADGLSALKNYHKNKKTGRPVHNWASHGSDSMRTLAMALHLIQSTNYGSNVVSMRRGGLRRRLRGTR